MDDGRAESSIVHRPSSIVHHPRAVDRRCAPMLSSLYMRVTTGRFRGGPIYVQTEEATISLVPEVTQRVYRLGPFPRAAIAVTGPSAVYLINGDGVERVPITSGRRLLFPSRTRLP